MKVLKLKCWVEDEGEKIYGPGPHQLLQEIQKEGSISKAAKNMGMSYKKAWDLVQRLNRHASHPLISLSKGGQHGGGAVITDHGSKVMEGYTELEKELASLQQKQQNLIRII